MRWYGNITLMEKGATMECSHHCPRCGSTETFRVHRKPREHFLPGYRAYLCEDCKSRFLVFELSKLLQWGSA